MAALLSFENICLSGIVSLETNLVDIDNTIIMVSFDYRKIL